MFKSIRNTKETEGFTLIELLITVVILAVIMGIAIPVYVNNKNSADDTAAKTEASLLGKTIADGIGTGSITGYTGTANGTTPLTGILTTQVGNQAIGNAKVYYDSVGGTWCVSKKVGSSIWMTTSVDAKPTLSSSECANSTSTPANAASFTYTTGEFTQGTDNQVFLPVVTGGAGPKTYSIASGTLPSNVTFDPATGSFTGPLNSAWNFTIAPATSVVVGVGHACALTTAGGIKCWGDNGNGQLGNGTNISTLAPTDVVGLTSGVTSIAAGPFNTCAVVSGGAKCWGGDTYGQLGNGTVGTDSLVPVNVTGLSSGVASIAIGDQRVCVVTTSGAAKCWGTNADGALGDGTTTDRSTPVSVVGLSSGVSSIALGVVTCAVVSGGAKCWGYNGYGELGNGTNTNSLTPVTVSGLSSGVDSVSVGSYVSCAVTTSGAAKCWGQNTNGTLGNGTVIDSNVPVDVTGLSSGVTSISVGSLNACAVVSGGAKCWGPNDYGQNGTGSVGSVNTTPVDVTGLSSGVASIASGGNYDTCIVTTSNSVKCWGYNGTGILGDRTLNDSATPVNTPIYVTEVGFPAHLVVQLSDATGTSNADILLVAP